MAHSETYEKAALFLEQLQRDAQVLPSEEIESIGNALTKTIAALRQVRNDRVPLFKLPVEILQRILELVPDYCSDRWRDFRVFWRNTLVDSSMLIPATHTCRRLREVALSHHRLWTTLRISREKLPLVHQMATWSEDIPLNATGNDIGVLEQLFYPNTCFESVHLYDIKRHNLHLLRTVIGEITSPALRSFSVFCDLSEARIRAGEPEPDPLVLSQGNAPNLRFLALVEVQLLPERGFSSLTHLALIDLFFCTSFSTQRNTFHSRLLDFLKECPQLESIVLMSFALSLPQGEVLRDRAPLPLTRLRHVTLCDFHYPAIRHYVSLLQPRVHESSVQVLDFNPGEPWFPRHFLLPPDSSDAPAMKQLCVGMHPNAPDEDEYSISVTTVSPSSTRRLLSRDIPLGDTITPYNWPSSILSQPPGPAAPSPLRVDEVWLYGFSGITIPRQSSPLMHLPHAARVVLATDCRLHYSDIPTLCHLPTALDPLPGPIAISAVKIVFGFSEPDEPFRERSRFASDPGVKYHLPLVQLFNDVRSGAYGYLKHFVLQVTPHMDVIREELDMVREAGRFETFMFERIATFPEMPGHSDSEWKERFPIPRL